MEAVWIMDYDYHTDKTYNRPGCPECNEPIGKDDDRKYHCFSCGKVVDVDDPEMVEWFRIRDETRTEVGECHVFTCKDGSTYGCGCKDSYVTNYVRNPVTLEWQAAYGGCKNCGIRFIV